MKTLDTLAALAAIASHVAATPLDASTGSVKATISQVYAGERYKDGAVDLARALRKYGATPDEEGLHAEKLALVRGSAPADPEAFDSEYLVPVTIGNQMLNLDLDTGSSDLWTFSSEQPAAQTKGRDVIYQCTNPKVAGETWKIMYGDGSSAMGNVVQDSVTLGGVKFAKQAVECATKVSGSFVRDKKSDGIFGFGFNNINQVRPNPVNTWFSNVKSKLDSPLFTASLKYRAVGSYDFGYIDNSKYTGSIAYSPVNSANGFWQFRTGGYSIGSGPKKTPAFSGVADTGTSLLLVGRGIAKAYWSTVPGAFIAKEVGGYVFPCKATLPTFSIYSGTKKHTIPGKYINYAPAGSSGGQKYCFGGIQRNGGLPFAVLGDIYLKSQFVVFDASVPRIGFAAQS